MFLHTDRAAHGSRRALQMKSVKVDRSSPEQELATWKEAVERIGALSAAEATSQFVAESAWAKQNARIVVQGIKIRARRRCSLGMWINASKHWEHGCRGEHGGR